MIEFDKKYDFFELLSDKIIERGYWYVGIEFMFKCLLKVEFYYMFIVNDVFNCYYILCINLDSIWVSCMI